MTKVKQASKNTCSAYQNDLHQFLAYLEENKVFDWNKVTETRMKAYLLYLKKQGKTMSTIARNLASIKKFVYYLVCQRVMDHDPTERIHSPKSEKSIPKSISREEINRLLVQPDTFILKGKRDRAILELLYATGIKVTELIELQIEDVNLRFGCITIHSKDKERVIPLSQSAKEALDIYIRELKRIECKQPYLFCNRNYTQLTRQGVWKLVKEYAAKAGIEDKLSIQIIRNSFASHMIENGADLQSMQELLGVGDISLAQKYVKTVGGETFKTYQRTHPRAKNEKTP